MKTRITEDFLYYTRGTARTVRMLDVRKTILLTLCAGEVLQKSKGYVVSHIVIQAFHKSKRIVAITHQFREFSSFIFY